MDADWRSLGLMGVDPRDLQLVHDGYHDPGIITSLQASETEVFNGTQSGGDSWPNAAPLTGTSIPSALAGPDMAMGAYDGGVSAYDGDFGIDNSLGTPGKYTHNKR